MFERLDFEHDNTFIAIVVHSQLGADRWRQIGDAAAGEGIGTCQLTPVPGRLLDWNLRRDQAVVSRLPSR